METTRAASILDDRRIKLLDFLLSRNNIPEYAEFDLKSIIEHIPAAEYKNLFRSDKDFDAIWQNVDMPQSLATFLLENDLAKRSGENFRLTERGRDLLKQRSYQRLLQDERHITSEARRVNLLEFETERIYRRQYKFNLLIALGTSIAGIYYLLEILNGFFGFYHYHH